eukprot:jgi/Ulvmu1/1285/UM011_0009.1
MVSYTSISTGSGSSLSTECSDVEAMRSTPECFCVPVFDDSDPGIHIHAELGQGSFGTVSLATVTTESGEKLKGALKRLRPNMRKSNSLTYELRDLMLLQGHRGVVEVLGYAHDQGQVTAMLTAAHPHTLKDVMQAYCEMFTMEVDKELDATISSSPRDADMGSGELPPIVPLKVLWPLILALSRTVAYLGDKGIVHGDIKLGNIVTNWAGQPALLDFGGAREEGASLRHRVGTPGYMAPEAEKASARNPVEAALSMDWYSLAKCVAELATGMGVEELTSATIGDRVCYDARLKHLLQRTLCEKPEDRLDIQVWVDTATKACVELKCCGSSALLPLYTTVRELARIEREAEVVRGPKTAVSADSSQTHGTGSTMSNTASTSMPYAVTQAAPTSTAALVLPHASVRQLSSSMDASNDDLTVSDTDSAVSRTDSSICSIVPLAAITSATEPAAAAIADDTNFDDESKAEDSSSPCLPEPLVLAQLDSAVPDDSLTHSAAAAEHTQTSKQEQRPISTASNRSTPESPNSVVQALPGAAAVHVPPAAVVTHHTGHKNKCAGADGACISTRELELEEDGDSTDLPSLLQSTPPGAVSPFCAWPYAASPPVSPVLTAPVAIPQSVMVDAGQQAGQTARTEEKSCQCGGGALVPVTGALHEEGAAEVPVVSRAQVGLVQTFRELVSERDAAAATQTVRGVQLGPWALAVGAVGVAGVVALKLLSQRH